MKLLVTGGLGYLGGRFAESATAAGHSLVLTTRRPAAQAGGAAQVATLTTSDAATLERLCNGVDVIVQLAGMNAAQAARDPDAAVHSRTETTSAWLRAARSAGVRRLIQVSTIHVYGPNLAGAIDENTPLAPEHPYARSHAAAEERVLAARARGEIDGIVVRLSNAYGAPADAAVDCWSLVTNDLARQAVRSGRMVLKSNGEQRRDFMPLADTCRALLHIGAAPELRQGVFNLGGGESLTMLEQADRIGKAVAQVTGSTPVIVPGADAENVPTQPLDYRMQRLLATGFAPDPRAAANELARLAHYCAALPS